ncbi:hypothetical protein J0910_30585 [Nocardiopsis sp. CNT-189]|uniref:hypothetical protein n=1 Tax=Nocardiopsis oceanisediminis TaxID=2816862 RepID=UPI003B39823C
MTRPAPGPYCRRIEQQQAALLRGSAPPPAAQDLADLAALVRTGIDRGALPSRQVPRPPGR